MSPFVSKMKSGPLGKFPSAGDHLEGFSVFVEKPRVHGERKRKRGRSVVRGGEKGSVFPENGGREISLALQVFKGKKMSRKTRFRGLAQERKKKSLQWGGSFITRKTVSLLHGLGALKGLRGATRDGKGTNERKKRSESMKEGGDEGPSFHSRSCGKKVSRVNLVTAGARN